VIDLIKYQDYIGHKTKFRRKPGPDPWYYARKLVSTYTDPPDVEEVIRQFENAVCKDEIAAPKWIVINDDFVTSARAYRRNSVGSSDRVPNTGSLLVVIVHAN
jgi:hypothetical protein